MKSRRCLTAIVSAVLAAGTMVLAGDPKVAETLFKSGKQAFQKGDHAGAVTFFGRALEEDPTLIEACFWRGSALDKDGDKAGAIVAWREYLSLFTQKSRAGATSKEEQRLKGLAEKSLDALAAGEKEMRKLEDDYVAALLAFAKKNADRDPGLARAALDALLAARPGVAEAQRLLEKLGGPSAAPTSAPPPAGKVGEAPGPFKAVLNWVNLIAERKFRSDGIEYTDAGMVYDTKTGSLLRSTEFIEVGTAFALETEFRVLAVHDRGWAVGFFVARRDPAFINVFVNTSRVVAIRVGADSEEQEVGSFDLTPVDLAAWHRFGVIVRGPVLEAWLDGVKAFEWKEPAGRDLVGEVGLFQQRCRTERRLLRTGRLE